ncbi:hypothetical protein [Pannonibacter sp. P2PFMT1]|uniref:hypothetical protein n=1 Tax=Pannonibacter sp. P2PFMT1 TaxID=2003582 RepID=UPI00164699B8|nr:hypothetical protein [Pannonibacter sp. P2PFMT1]
MQTSTFTTPRGAEITLSFESTKKVTVTIKGHGEYKFSRFEGGFIHAWGLNGKIEVPAEAVSGVKSVVKAWQDAVSAEYLASAEGFSDQMHRRMYGRNSAH